MFKRIKQIIYNYFNPRSEDSTEFLPSVLAIQETSPHPAPRVFLWIVIIIICSILLWTIIGKTEIVAIADGSIISSDKSQTIQVFEHAKVRKIYVRDGSSIKKGDILLELDQDRYQADLDSVDKEIIFNKAQLLRNNALLEAIIHNRPPIKLSSNGISENIIQQTQNQLKSDYDNIQSRLSENRTKTQVINQEIISYHNAILEKKKLLELKSQKLNNYKSLAREDFLPKNRYLEIEEEVLNLRSEMSNLLNIISEKKAHITNLRVQADVIIEEVKNNAIKDSQEANRKLSIFEEDRKKAISILDTTKIIAPVSGTVQQLAVNTVGGVLTPAQPVMVIVPEDVSLEAEVTFLNKDIGFIEVGQIAHVKIESFPYTKYGLIDGEVSVVSGDAVEDEKRGLVYKGRVKLRQSVMRVGKRDVHLVPGMRLTAEIKTDEKRLIDYFLSPLIKNTTQAFRER
jgi:hemolysin D